MQASLDAISRTAARRFLGIFLGVLGAALAVVAGINLAADPFRVFGTSRKPGWNDRVPNTSGFDRMAKPYEILRVEPRTVLLGSSTAHSGFLTLEYWDTGLAKPAYNYALLGANAREVSASLAQAVRESKVETAIVVADFFAYNIHYTENEAFSVKRLEAASHRWGLGFTLEDLGAFALGIDSLKYSWNILRDSRASRKVGKAPAISSPSPNESYPWETHFRNCEISYLTKWFPPPARRYEFSDQKGRDRLASFEEMLRQCADKGTRLIVIIPPVHARFQEAMAAAGAWSHYEAFKRMLTSRTNDHHERSTPTGTRPNVELWDFSLFNDHTTERVPPPTGPAMSWWIDSAHFTPEFGLKIINDIMDRTDPTAPRLGVRLAPKGADIEQHLAMIRAGLAEFRSTQSAVVADVRAALGIAIPPPLSQ